MDEEETRPGQMIRLEVRRGESLQTVEMSLGTPPAKPADPAQVQDAVSPSRVPQRTYLKVYKRIPAMHSSLSNSRFALVAVVGLFTGSMAVADDVNEATQKAMKAASADGRAERS